MFLSLNGSILNENDTININLQQNSTYIIACSSINSKPEVSISIYDTKTNLSISNGNDYVISKSCNGYNLCTVIYQYQLQSSNLLNRESITCKATSLITDIDLVVFTNRLVNSVSSKYNLRITKCYADFTDNIEIL